MQSGSGLCDWALQRDPLKNAQSIGKQLKCPISSSDDLIDCVKTAPVVDILRSEKNLKVIFNSDLIYCKVNNLPVYLFFSSAFIQFWGQFFCACCRGKRIFTPRSMDND